jgi:chromosome segregation ATPase
MKGCLRVGCSQDGAPVFPALAISMEEAALKETGVDQWREGLARQVEERRQKARQLLTRGRERLRELEATLGQRFDHLARQIAQEDTRTATTDERARALDDRQRELSLREQKVGHLIEDVQRRLIDLQTRQNEVEAASKELHIRQTECSQREAEVARHQAELGVRSEDVARKKQELDQQQQILEQAHKSQQAESDRLKEKLREYQQLEKDLERETERLKVRELETQKQRRHIAQQLRLKKGEVAKEAELHRAEALASSAGQELQLQMRLSELQAKYEKLRDEVVTSTQQTAEANKRAGDLQKQLELKQKELDTRHKESSANQAAREQFEALRRQFDTDKQKVQGEGQKKYEEARRQLEAAQGELAKRRAEAEVRASELKKLQDELSKRGADADSKGGEAQRLAAELERTRREMQQQIELLKSDQSKSHDEQVRSLQNQLDEMRQQHESERTQGDLRSAEWERQRKDMEAELAQARSSAASANENYKELVKLQEENKQLQTWLSEAEAKARSGVVGAEMSQEMEELRRRFDLALEDLRELKSKNADLSDQLARARAAPAADGGGGMDWESQKRRMLEQLDSEFDENDPEQKAEKLKIEDAIKKAERAVAEKDQELEELRRMLDNQSKNVGEVAVGASAIAAALDSDEIVKQERENLQQIKAKLREELKKAEVDCSLERAKIARERAELEERLRQFQAEKDALGMVEPGVGGSEKGKKKGAAGGGKWLARLGLGADKGK